MKRRFLSAILSLVMMFSVFALTPHYTQHTLQGFFSAVFSQKTSQETLKNSTSVKSEEQCQLCSFVSSQIATKSLVVSAVETYLVTHATHRLQQQSIIVASWCLPQARAPPLSLLS